VAIGAALDRVVVGGVEGDAEELEAFEAPGAEGRILDFGFSILD
jgi:hypothetical protein